MEGMTWVLALVGAVLGWLMGRWMASSKAETKHAQTLTEHEARRFSLEKEVVRLESELRSRQEALDSTKEALLDVFKSAANEALQTSNKQFLELAKENLQGTVKQAEGNLDQRKAAIEELLKPLRESIDKHKLRTDQVEKQSMETFGKVAEMLTGLKGSHASLEKQTGELVSALKNSRVRGRWGEIGLRRVVEFSGMKAHCHFTEQTTTSTEDGRRLRPDMVVNLPDNRNIVVDSKLPLDAFMDALETPDEEAKSALIKKHAKDLRGHMNQLSRKEYWDHIKTDADFVILYLEVESAFAAAIDVDPKLIEDGLQNKIIFATPTTLIAILRSIAITWQQHELNANAQLIVDKAAELHGRLTTYAGHISGVGKGLQTAVSKYNAAVASWDARVVPAGRKLEELHGKIQEEGLVKAPLVEESFRVLSSAEPEEGLAPDALNLD